MTRTNCLKSPDPVRLLAAVEDLRLLRCFLSYDSLSATPSGFCLQRRAQPLALAAADTASMHKAEVATRCCKPVVRPRIQACVHPGAIGARNVPQSIAYGSLRGPYDLSSLLSRLLDNDSTTHKTATVMLRKLVTLPVLGCRAAQGIRAAAASAALNALFIPLTLAGCPNDMTVDLFRHQSG